MTSSEFQITYGGELKSFLETKAGQAFMQVIGSLRPGYEYPQHDHLLIENRGATRGYEMCLRNMISLSYIKPSVKEPEINYGVTDNK